MAETFPLDTEHDRIERWRLKTLIDAGYPVPIAERVARELRVDLHQAVKLVKDKGCQPELAVEILI